MKIMILTGSMGSGGAQTHIFELARGLMARGHKVILVSSGGQTARALARLGAKCFCVKTDTKRPLSLLGGALALHALILRERPDVIHAHTRPFGLLCKMIKQIIKSPLPIYVSTVHARFSTDSALHRLAWYSSSSIAVGEDLKQYLLSVSRGNLLPERIKVIPNGIDTARFCPRERESDNDSFRLCFMSRLDGDCSSTAYMLCRIAPRICERIDNAEIFIIGGGSELGAISSLAENINRDIGRRVIRVLGGMDAPELVLSRCDGFIGVSRAALEAMSCAVPVILSGNEGFGDLLQTEKDLMHAKSSNFCCRGRAAATEDELLKSILKLYSMSRRERAELGDKMRRFVIENNSSDKMAADTERFYNDALVKVPRREPEALLCGYYGFDNMGDDALLMQAIERAKNGAVALTSRPKRAELKFGVRCIDRSNPFKVAKAIKSCKKFVFGGGTLLQSRTSFRSLCWYSALLIYAKAQGKCVELWANGIGDLDGKLSRKLSALALRAADRIGVRDERSASLARSLVPERHPNIIIEDDLALSCPAASDERLSYILSELGIKDGERFAVVCPKGYAGIRLLNPRERKKARREYAALRSHLKSLQKQKIIPIFVPMYPAQDMTVSARMCSSYGGRLARRLGISELIALISRSDSVISMRYHPLLFAKKLGKFGVKIGDDPKLLSL